MKKNRKKSSSQFSGKKPDVFLHEGHKLLTRRDFLSAGAIQFSAMMFAPTLLTQLLRSNEAWAACPTSGGATGPALPAFVQFNLSGGAMLGANFVPRNQGGGLIANMNLMGLGTNASALETALTSELGVAVPSFLTGVNAGGQAASLINGLRTTAQATTLDRTAVVAVVARGRDDTNMNRLDVSGLIASAGLAGSSLPNISTGGFDQSPTLFRSPPPLIVNSYDDIRGAIGVAGPLGAATFPAVARDALFKLVGRLSDSEASRLLGSRATNGGEVQELIGCATTANVDIASATPPPTDIRQIAAIAGIWGVNAGSAATAQGVVFGSMVHAALQGYSGPVRFEAGGYDYHNNTRTTGNDRDNAAGQVLGRILETAANLNRPIFVYVSTDGSCRSAESADMTAPWVSDRGQAGVTLIFAFHPSGRPNTAVRSGTGQVAQLANQIGYLTSGQAADENYTLGWNDERAATAVFANYLSWALSTGYRTVYDRVVSGANGVSNPFTNAELDKILRL